MKENQTLPANTPQPGENMFDYLDRLDRLDYHLLVAGRIGDQLRDRDPLTVDELGTIADAIGCTAADLLPPYLNGNLTPRSADHGITIVDVRMPAGTPLRASCLCGWQSEIVPSRPEAQAAGSAHVALKQAIVGELARASHCSCGRRAVHVLDGGAFGPTGYCGAPQRPIDPCDCGQGAEQHSRNVCHVYGRGMAKTAVAR